MSRSNARISAGVTYLPLGNAEVSFASVFSKTFYELTSWTIPVKLVLGVCHIALFRLSRLGQVMASSCQAGLTESWLWVNNYKPLICIYDVTCSSPIFDGSLASRYWWKRSQISLIMMTSSNDNIFRITGHLCGEFTGAGEFPAQRPVMRSFDVFFDLCLTKRLRKQSWGWWFETLSHQLWRQCNVCHKSQY